ncbi:FxLYD domain-containing protein [Paenibacillus chitinolyticus]|uniref:FxLYD domain-containing protein n=1 Tax=Paenibacillus chitinolyticus TaxID=79263 RepID=UPI002DB5B49D|nr:FxLYD domain-containing protein [Paenibacillus chitinolyticus]MEC0248887.1 FxLYD domain-containing protein [Paenibacillus chitinolyticus]
MKKILFTSLAAIALIAGCSSEQPAKSSEPPKTTTTPTEAPKATPASTPEATTKPSEAPQAKEGEYTAGDFKITGVSAKETAGMWVVTAKVENTGSKDVQVAMLSAVLYDKDGKRLGVAQGGIDGMKKGESKTIQFISTDKLEGYKKVEFQVDTTM